MRHCRRRWCSTTVCQRCLPPRWKGSTCPEPENHPQGEGAATAHQLLILADHIGAICVATPEASRTLMPELFAQGARLSFDAEQLIALCNRAAHEWREWGTQLELETGPMPLFEECAVVPLHAAAPPAPKSSRRPRRRASRPSAALRVFRARRVACAPRRHAVPPAAPAATPARVSEFERMCVLLVGEEARVRRPLRGTLDEAGFRVVEAADGRQGLSLAIECSPR
jgi:hypothetical protein